MLEGRILRRVTCAPPAISRDNPASKINQFRAVVMGGQPCQSTVQLAEGITVGIVGRTTRLTGIRIRFASSTFAIEHEKRGAGHDRGRRIPATGNPAKQSIVAVRRSYSRRVSGKLEDRDGIIIRFGDKK